MPAAARVWMRLELKRQDLEDSLPIRGIEEEDTAALAELTLAAYQGTIDYEGETLAEAQAEIEKVFASRYGPLIPEASTVVEEEGRLLAACFVTLYEERPFVVFMMTHPEHKGRGLGTQLLQTSIDALLDRGHAELDLVVTDGNTPAQRVYEKLGFEVVMDDG